MAGAGTPRPQRDDREVVSVVAEFGGLWLAADRAEGLAALLEVVREEQTLLRDVAPVVEPHAVFDPRWD